ncbi:MAG TPA: hypothetical protein VKY31_05860, partial [Terriglobia bacterium]|nr:hypothetical protein [Terriglobia bacterium]
MQKDPLGLYEPQSVRSILLLYSGKSISKAKAEELEADVRKNPEKIESRLLLIGYYGANAKTAAERTKLREHVLWMVQNHPEHPATAEPALREIPDDADGNAKILALWTKNIAAHPDDLAVMKDAEKYFFGKDPAEADQLIHQISAREPDNREWPTELANLYRMFGVPGETINDPAQRAVEAYKRVLALTNNQAARQSLAGDMAQDAFKLGDFPAAATLAKIYLDGVDRAAVQRGNTILGRIALRSGDLESSKQYLLASAGQGAARDISVSGPTLILAKELLEHGERDAVVEYLEKCAGLWPRGQDALQLW